VYAGAQRDFAYRVYNISPLSDVFNVLFWDDSGWVTLDSVDRFVASGDSTDVMVPVIAPPGIPLGSRTTVHCKAVSANDSGVFHETAGTAFTVLQYGDVTFDGPIDIGDVTYLISYLFIEGPAPLPVSESGNFDCDGPVDISDLTLLIRFLFLSGGNSPCNPL